MLYIYKASAGSGKTHLLTGFYIRLLFRRDLLPPEVGRAALFDEILAVTFTNKATAEMKERIVTELHKLSTVPTQSDYYKDVNPEERRSADDIAADARRILGHVLNDYGSFNISTIDSFFQRIVRSFAREQSLMGNYEVELNADRVYDAAVTSLISELDTDDGPRHGTFDWLLKFARNRIAEGAGWDLKKPLLQMAKRVLPTEDYRRCADKIAALTSDRATIAGYTERLQAIAGQFRSTLRSLGAEMQRLLDSHGLTADDFKNHGNGNIATMLLWTTGEVKEPGKTMLQYADNPESCYSAKGINASAFTPEVVSDVGDLLRRGVAHFDDHYSDYQTAQVILQNIYQLGILADIDRKARDYCAEQGIMLLSSTTELLNKLVSRDDAPFIYERTGTHIHSFMIDEFQDTSAMQWDNFRPLLSDSLAAGYPNLIVGDVKQSIYRFRGSDWDLLHRGLDDYESTHHADGDLALRTNYRSERAIVEFNNTFFAEVSTELGLDEVFGDVAQNLSSQAQRLPDGVVDVRRIDATDDERQTVDGRRAAAMRMLPDVVMALEDRGFEARDIAILARRNDICAQAAETLLRYRQEHPDDVRHTFDVISDEALLLAARPAIQTLISLMQHLATPSSPILKAVAACNLLQLGGLSMDEAMQRFFASGQVHPHLAELSHRPLYELVEGLIALLPALPEGETAFLQAFRDVVLEFTASHSADLGALLEWWDEEGHKRSIAMPETQNAIRIMTIHKAKGLGMPAVVMPFIEDDVATASSGDLIWCRPPDGPFALGDISLPVAHTKALSTTIFAADYAAECRRYTIDNLNTAYVSFTRAKEVLVMFLSPSGIDKPTTLQGMIASCVDRHPTLCSDIGGVERDPRLVAQRSAPAAVDPHHTPSPAATLPATQPPPGDAPALPRLSMRQSRLEATDDAIVRGNCIHAVLSAIDTTDDIDAALASFYAHASVRERSVVPPTEMKALVGQLLAHDEVRPWFDTRCRVLNERTLLDADGEMRRPDRIVLMPDGHVVVVDYKTGHHDRRYARQVARYMALLRAMGFADVEGYIWYVTPHEVERVEP